MTSELDPTQLKILEWRIKKLEHAGFSPVQASLIAFDRTIDTERACALLRSGCTAELAVEILV